jgi:hypothetical protein
VSESDVIFVDTLDVIATAEAVEDITSPTLPAPAASFVVVPTIPPVVGENVIDVAIAAPNVGEARTGLVENTRLVDVVPVAPDAVYPVILLNEVMDAELALVPPLATGNTPVTSVVNTALAATQLVPSERMTFPLAPGTAYVSVEATQFVPSATIILRAVDEVLGNVGVDVIQFVPLLTSTFPAVEGVSDIVDVDVIQFVPSLLSHLSAVEGVSEIVAVVRT